MSFDVKGKVALVTGANRGIGKELVKGLIEAGAQKVYAAVRQPDSAKSLIDEFGAKVEAVEVDLTRPETITAAANSCADVSLVINNAGILRTASPLSEDAIECLQAELETNLFGLLRVAQAFAPVLKRNGGGALVQLNSVVSMKCFPEFTTYCASKAASYSVTQGLRGELASQGTQVYSVHPGPIATDMAHAAGLGEMADPPRCVPEALLEAFKTGQFHVFPDTMAKQIGGAYASFAKNVIES